MIHRGFRFKLAPTLEQEAQFRQFSGVCRLVYNLALEQRRDWWRQFQREAGYPLNFVAQSRELTALRAACGCIDKRSRESQARFLCVHCGHEAHADTNAAIEILRRNTASMRMEGLHFGSIEVRTGRRVNPPENPAFREGKMLTQGSGTP